MCKGLLCGSGTSQDGDAGWKDVGICAQEMLHGSDKGHRDGVGHGRHTRD